MTLVLKLVMAVMRSPPVVKGLAAADATQVIAWAGLYSMFFFVTLYMQNVLHYSQLRSRLSYVPVSVGIGLGSTVATKMFIRTGTRPIIVSGALLAADGILWLCPHPGGWHLSRQPAQPRWWSWGPVLSVPPGKVNSRWPSASATGSPVSRCAPTDMKPSWLVSNASSRKPASPNQDRIAGVRSGGLRCLVHRTSAPGAHRLGRAATVAWMSLPVMLPKMPHATTIWAGTAPGAGIGDPGVGLQHLDAVQPSRLRRLPRERDVALVQLDQPGAHVVPARMPGQHADHVPALPGAQADQADVPGGRTFELGAQVPLHEFPPPREQ